MEDERRPRWRGALAAVGVAAAVVAGTALGIAALTRRGHDPGTPALAATASGSTATTVRLVPTTTVQTPPIGEPIRRQLEAALGDWATFPVTQVPRPLVLTGDQVDAPATGFPSDDTKEAYLTGLFTVPNPLPSGPATAGGYPVTTAADALATMRAEGTPVMGAPRPPSPLRVTSVQFGDASFQTDRGNRMLPAWLFSFDGVQHPAAVLAVRPSSQYRRAKTETARFGARLGADGRTVTLTFVGAAAGNGPCTAAYAVDSLTSQTAVAAIVRQTRGTTGTCTLVGYPRTVHIQLPAPLGNRVVVDGTNGSPATVTP